MNSGAWSLPGQFSTYKPVDFTCIASFWRVFSWRLSNGGSNITRSKVCFGLLSLQPDALAFVALTLASRFKLLRFSQIVRWADLSSSSAIALFAPRLIASKLNAPLPAKGSSTVRFAMSPSALNRAPRTRSLIGWVRFPGGELNTRPPRLPAIIRT